MEIGVGWKWVLSCSKFLKTDDDDELDEEQEEEEEEEEEKE